MSDPPNYLSVAYEAARARAGEGEAAVLAVVSAGFVALRNAGYSILYTGPIDDVGTEGLFEDEADPEPAAPIGGADFSAETASARDEHRIHTWERREVDAEISWHCLVCPERTDEEPPVWVEALADPAGDDSAGDPDAERGHTFRISVASRGSYSVTGVPGHTDADVFDVLPQSVEVRAWNLRDALIQAAALPLRAWYPDEET